MELLLSTLLALYAVVTFPSGYLLLTAIVSVAAYAFTESYFSVLGVLILMTLLRIIKSALLPTIEPSRYGAVGGPVGGAVVGVEGFQPKDPISIHKRVTDTKGGNPLQPKVQNVQGVLESAGILNSLQISEVAASERGAATQTLPAMVGMTEPIRTPLEGFMPNVASPDNGAPRGNPFLQGGADDEAVNTALNKNALASSNINGNSSNEEGANSGPAPVE